MHGTGSTPIEQPIRAPRGLSIRPSPCWSRTREFPGPVGRMSLIRTVTSRRTWRWPVEQPASNGLPPGKVRSFPARRDSRLLGLDRLPSARWPDDRDLADHAIVVLPLDLLEVGGILFQVVIKPGADFQPADIARTREWWTGERDSYDCYISAAVLDELRSGDYANREACLTFSIMAWGCPCPS